MSDDTPRRQRRASGPQSAAEATSPGAGSNAPETAPDPPQGAPAAPEEGTGADAPQGQAAPGEGTAASQGQAAPGGTAPWGDPAGPPPNDDGSDWTGAAGPLSYGLSRAMYLLRAVEHDVVNLQLVSGNPHLNAVRTRLSRAMEYIEGEGQPGGSGDG